MRRIRSRVELEEVPRLQGKGYTKVGYKWNVFLADNVLLESMREGCYCFCVQRQASSPNVTSVNTSGRARSLFNPIQATRSSSMSDSLAGGGHVLLKQATQRHQNITAHESHARGVVAKENIQILRILIFPWPLAIKVPELS